MRFSTLFAPTLKEVPAEAELVSHRLLLRAGMIRKLAAGIYNYLPLGLRALRKVEQIVREEMDASGAQEVLMPSVVPAELWKESRRWEQYGKELLRIRDRHDREFCYGPTHEEVVTNMVRGELRSYKQLPVNLYQIQTKFRDEIRPRFGLMRGREFIMKDAYSFHATAESLDETYQTMRRTYRSIFERCGLAARAVEADTGAIGGSASEEFMVLAESGEDAIAACNTCDYASNVEMATCAQPLSGLDKASGVFDQQERKGGSPQEVATPGQRTIAEVSKGLGIAPEKAVKTLVYTTDKGPILALVRGTDELNEVKLLRAVGAEWATLAEAATIEKITGAPTGFAGPVGLKDKAVPIYADREIRYLADVVVGANKADAHLVDVVPGRDFEPAAWVDLRTVRSGDPCPRCSPGKLELMRGIEVGHIFKLGTKYSELMGATFLDENGKERPFIMGCYGIGIGRTMAAAIEQHHDENGIRFPMPLAPMPVALLSLNADDAEVNAVAEDIYTKLRTAGIEVLFDDRNERAGIKFKDADLIGLPLRVAVGRRGLAEGKIELRHRGSGNTEQIPTESVIGRIIELVGRKA